MNARKAWFVVEEPPHFSLYETGGGGKRQGDDAQIVMRYTSAERAWKSAERRAKTTAAKTGERARYAMLPDHLKPAWISDRAAWVVGSEA